MATMALRGLNFSKLHFTQDIKPQVDDFTVMVPEVTHGTKRVNIWVAVKTCKGEMFRVLAESHVSADSILFSSI